MKFDTNRNPIAKSSHLSKNLQKADIEQSIPPRFEQMVETHADRLAVKSKSYSWTFAQLNRQANRLAHAILEKRGDGEEAIALLLENDAPLVASILGVLKTGKIYVPLDPSFPKARTQYILENSQAAILVTDHQNLPLAKELAQGKVPIINRDELNSSISEDNPGLSLSPDCLAFILYTSGSTGQPKGIVHNHRNLLHEIMNYTNGLQMDWADHVALLSSCSFVDSVRAFYGALLKGATLFPYAIKEEGFADMANWLAREEITVCRWVPTVFRHFIASLSGGEKFPAMRIMNLSGEPVIRSDVEACRKHFRKDCILVNSLGATETFTFRWLFIDQNTSITDTNVPVGYDVDDQEVFVLDEAGQPVPFNEIGEIAVKSHFLSGGYWRKPDLTKAAFSSDPEGSGAQIYRTGDLGLMRPDGCLVHMGRKDFQVKIKGYRIEASEIETAFRQSPSVQQTVVVPLNDEDGEPRLVAYVVPTGEAPTTTDLRTFLEGHLPGYMIPSAFVMLEHLPRTATGKVDRLALPPPGLERPALNTPFVAPRNPTEEMVAQIWADVLGLDEVGVNDPFLELGGDSLRAAQLISRVLNVFRAELSMQTLLDAPTVADMSSVLDLHPAKGVNGSNGAVAPMDQSIPLRKGTGPAPLSFSQERLWFVCELEHGNPFYNISRAFRLEGHLDLDSLKLALNAMVSRHESLRTVFRNEEGAPVQVIEPLRPVELEEVDLSEGPIPPPEQEIQLLMNEEAKRPFDLSKDLMIRTKLIRIQEDDHVLVLIFHHLVSDRCSSSIALHEISEFYKAFSMKEAPTLPELPIQYSDFAHWERTWLQGEILEKQFSYWKECLSGNPTLLDLPTDRPRPIHQSYRGARERITIPADLTDALKKLGQKENATLFMTMLAAFQILLYRYSGAEDIAVGSPISNRNRLETERLIGFFVNTLVLRTDLSGNPTFRELVERVREMVVGGLSHQNPPLEKLMDALKVERTLSHSPLFQVMFALQNAPAEKLLLPDVHSHPLDIHSGTAKFDISLSMEEENGTLRGFFEYNTDLFDRCTIQRMVSHFQTLLEGVVAHPEHRISELPLLNDAERHQLLVDWNETGKAYSTGCIHELFESQAEKTPEAVAVAFEDETITYEELNQRANQLAHHLRSLGVGPDALVGIHMKRSIEMMVSLFGILKAGGAYVPLDPTYPEDRIAFMAEDAQMSVMLTDADLAANVSGVPHVVCVDQDWETISRERDDNPESGATHENLAYVIYTSGSTGKPKGVMVEHGNAVNFFVGMDDQIPTAEGDNSPGTWLAITSLSFDISVLEVFWTLTRGFKVVLYSDRVGFETVSQSGRSSSSQPMDFSFFYFASGESEEGVADKYHLLLEGAKFADQNGFSAVWTPERHFHEFGGLYPNPSVAGAAIGAITENVQIRAGSCVVPLHNPIRVAEEWSFVDNLSKGRVGIAVASGWQPNDFVLAPDNYTRRRELMYENVDIIQKLWAGETVSVPGPAGKDVTVQTLPRPIQDRLPIWVTARSPDTFKKAGAREFNLLTHLLGLTPDQLAEDLKAYRQAWREAGHPGEGHVALMLHTFVGEDIDFIRETVREPMKGYLSSSMGLVASAAESFSLIQEKAEVQGRKSRELLEAGELSDEDRDALLTFAFERYFEISGLFGTPESCMEMVDKLKAIGVDEIACLIDFGVPSAIVFDHFKYLNQLRELAEPVDTNYSIPALVEKHQVTHFQCTPSMAAMLLADESHRAALARIQTMMVGGEALPVAIAEELKEVLPGVLLNMYGPTETTIWSPVYPVDGTDGEMSIGRPIANTEIYILNGQFQPTPIGVAGELFIGGDGVVRGYWGREELTAERFIQNPFASKSDARMYRTGDLARYRPDGNIEFLGRADFQVKIRGHRIELGEIEALLDQQTGVQTSVVVTVGENLDNKRLVAYVIPVSGGEPPSIDELRTSLKSELPDYMIPSQFVFLEAFPLTPNGKIDRRSLPAPEAASAEEKEFVTPRNEVEQGLAEIWQEALGIERIGIHDNLFEIGGNSLLATVIVSRTRDALNTELPLRSLFEYPSIAELAQIIGQREMKGVEKDGINLEPQTTPIPQRKGVDPCVPSFAQERLWFLDQLEECTAAYNMYRADRLKGSLNKDALEKAFQAIIDRHESLRTTFIFQDEVPFQVVDPDRTIELEEIDLRGKPEDEVQHVITQEGRRHFDLSQDLMLRAKLFRVEEEEHILLIVMHHIASDGWSVGILLRELRELYEANADGRLPNLAELPIQYADFSEWQRRWLEGERFEELITYWKAQLAGSPPLLDLPTDRPRPVRVGYQGTREKLTVSSEILTALEKLSQQEGVTLFMTLLALFQTLLYRYTRSEDIAVGSPIAGRTRTETEGLIGFFINTLVLRSDLSGDPTFRQFMSRVRDMAIGAYAHQELPFEKLVTELQPVRSLSYSPIFQVMFVLQNAHSEILSFPGLETSPYHLDRDTADFDLTLSLHETSGGLEGTLEYNTDLFEQPTIQRMVGHLRELCQAVVNEPDLPLSKLPMLGEAERQRLLVEWSGNETASQEDACIHELFEAQAAHTPNAIAVTFGEEYLTYRDLDQRANQMAHHLQIRGVSPGKFVGVCMEHSIDALVSLLGIFKAGGAYLPLDPGYPQERLAFMLEDTQASVVLTQKQVLDRLPECQAQIICVEQEREVFAQERHENPVNGFVHDQVAYVIYTSGSTGRPKGVLVTHKSIAGHCKTIQETYGLRPDDSVLQFASLSFDMSLEEILPTLLVGAHLIVSGPNVADIANFHRTILDHDITVLHLPPAFWHQVVQEWSERPEPRLENHLRTVVIGGDVMPPESLRLWQKTPAASARLFNTYGPTETTITATTFEILPQNVEDVSDRRVPIGRALPGRRLYILDKNLEPVPVGVPGELHIGGAGLAQGYLNRPELTAEKFIPNPFSNAPGARLYKTGDLVRYLPDGNIEFLGRIDDQVKVRGFRIELGEIEALLDEHPAIRESVVSAREDIAGDKRLVAYVVARSEPPGVPELRTFLRERLPDYMVPSAFVMLDMLPINASGKVDRKVLPAPEKTRPEMERAFSEPRTDLEKDLAKIWADVLDLDRIGVHDNFFDLGGHSLLATQVLARIRSQMQVEIPLISIFEGPSVNEMAALISQQQGSLKDQEGVGQLLSEVEGLSEEEVKRHLSGENGSDH